MGMLAPFVAGLGLYFCGIRFLSLNLTPLAGRRFRLALTRLLAWRAAPPFAGILGGYLAETVATGMGLELYFNRAFSVVEMSDYIPATLKTMVFGFIIATVASYLGFNTSTGTEGVGRASTRAVVASSMLIIVVNVLLVRVILFVYPQTGGL